MKINKKGEEKIISVYWFIVLILVAGGIFLMVNSFYNYPYDVRKIEAQILEEKVANCIYSGGEFNPDLIHISNSQVTFKEEFKDNFLKRCNLNFDSESRVEEIQYYVSAEFFEVENYRSLKGKMKSVFNLSAGNPNWKADCNFEEDKYGRLVYCLENDFFAFANEQKQYRIKITSMVRKTEQNVKM